MSERRYNILFHGIGTPKRGFEPDEEGYWLGADQFLRLLDEVADWPGVRISFDDGNSSDLEIALPALVDRGLHADFFALAGRLGQRGSLDGDGLRALHKNGMGVGTHGMWHRSWRGMDRRATHDELIAARDRLADEVGSLVDAAACPLGQYDRRLLAHLHRLGYREVFTSDRRPAHPGAWLQPRFSARATDTPESFRAHVIGRRSLPRRLRATAASVAKRLR
jgi:peptidoglycan/xylan/chitin deacetylase (PgdA/CDA1 family)